MKFLKTLIRRITKRAKKSRTVEEKPCNDDRQANAKTTLVLEQTLESSLTEKIPETVEYRSDDKQQDVDYSLHSESRNSQISSEEEETLTDTYSTETSEDLNICIVDSITECSSEHRTEVSVATPNCVVQAVTPSLNSKYVIEKELGKGAFGTVRLAKDTETGQQVAIKELKAATTEDEEVQMDEEIYLMRQLRHTNIIKFYDVIQHPDTGVQHLVMEYAPNGDLWSYIYRSKGLVESHARRLFMQLASAIEYLHSLNVVHRDIKPENILLDSNLTLKLCDFGFSWICEPNELMTSACGTYLYNAPEILSNLPYDGKAADVWALGVVLYEMVTGERPWKVTTRTEHVYCIKRGKFKLPWYLSKACRELIKRMLVVSPAQRARISEIMKHPWIINHHARWKS